MDKVISIELINEQILLSMSNKDLASAENAFMNWKQIANRPSFLYKKCIAEGMTPVDVERWKEFLVKGNFDQICIKLLKQTLLHKEEKGSFPTILYMVLTQDDVQDIKTALSYMEINFSIIRQQFKFLSEFENYNLPDIDPVVQGIEVEVHSNLRIEFATLKNGKTELWSRQTLIRDDSGILTLKVWNTTPTLLPNREVCILDIENI